MSGQERFGAPEKIRLTQFSIFNVPPRPSVMAVINKGYADDSRPNDRIWVVGGYMGHDLQWEDFEVAWQKMLNKHDVPYFHMKEMGKPNGVYAKWHPPKEHEKERIEFFKDITDVISNHYLRPFFSITRIEDLSRFNAEFGLSIEPYPLAAYGCMISLSQLYMGIPIEIVFDHVDKVSSKLAKAVQYARNDTYYPYAAKNIIPIPLPESVTWRQVRPLQAADFLAWEMQKHHIGLEEWFEIPDKPTDQIARWAHMDNWSLEKHGDIRPPARKSLNSVVDRSPEPACIIWDYQNLCQAHRHRGGVW